MVLVVDDEQGLRELVCRTLQAEGFTTLEAAHGAEALEVMEGAPEPVDLVITDVVMPGMDGPTMVREARKTRPDLKILFMSGYAEEQLRKSIDIENVNFLPK
ncbi:MAG TPA: response regulator, partial [Gemmatimonadales bacterium]